MQRKTLLHHSEVHRYANLKLGSSKRRGSPLTNGFGHHGSKAGRQGLEVLLCSEQIIHFFNGEGCVTGG
jgi:hypothetical protein